MPAALRAPTSDLLSTLAPEMSWPRRTVLANQALFEPLLVSVLERRPSSNASVRTTHAVTVIEGGTKDNVLPTRARAWVNFRIAPGDTVDDVIAHVTETIDDERLELHLEPGWRNPTAISAVDSDGFHTVSTTIRQMFPGTVVAPYLTIAGTDARHFEGIADDVYRFVPIRFEYDDRLRVHGQDERIAVADYAAAIRFYMALVKNL
jgi:carboxypeptidase PM20D1